MAHYAFINDQNVVVEVIVGRDENDLPHGVVSWEEHYGQVRGMTCLRTSYNTRYIYEYEFDDSVPPKVISASIIGSEHSAGGTPFRGTYAGIGYTYDPATDKFLPPVVEDAPL
jgi:hypothetical protein